MAAHAAAHKQRVVVAVADQLKRLLDGALGQRVPRVDALVVVVVHHADKLDVDVVGQTVVEEVLLGLLARQPQDCLEVELLEERLVDDRRLAQPVEVLLHGAEVKWRDDAERGRLRDAPHRGVAVHLH